MTHTVLILGASGRFGRHAAQAFATAGWRVRTFDRSQDDLWDAAWGAAVIVNAWHMPPQNWATEVPAQHARVREVALASGATVIIPGNVYAFGETMPGVLNAETPQLPTTRYGEIRKDMEHAYRRDGVRTIVLRAGDFLDDAPSGNWFDKVMVQNLPHGRFVYPGPRDVPHAWAFLPDLARAAVGLAERRLELPQFADIPYAGLTLTGEEMRALVEDAAGLKVKAKRFPWFTVQALQPVWATARYLVAMRYLWQVPHQLDPAPLARWLPEHRDSSAAAAIAAAIQHKVNPDQAVTGDPVTW